VQIVPGTFAQPAVQRQIKEDTVSCSSKLQKIDLKVKINMMITLIYSTAVY
jgi:hypothetical protein